MTTNAHDQLLNIDGRVMFYCRDCREPITREDIFELSLRLPEEGESRDEYMEAELIDDIRHLRCIRAAQTV